jgi:hypothetical protein
MHGSERFIAREFPPDGDRLLSLNPRGTRLAVSHENADHVQVFDTRSGAEVGRLTGFTRVSAVLFLSAEVLLVAAYGGCFRCNLRLGGRDLLSPEGWQTSVTLSPDGRKLAIGVRIGLSLYDLARKKEVRRFEACFDPGAGAFHAGISPGGRYLAATLYEGGRAGGIVVVWDARTGRRQRVYDTRGYAFAFRGDTLTLAVSADSGYVEIYEPDEGEAVARRFFFDYHIPRAMEFRDRGRTLAMLLDDGEFVQVDAGTGRVRRRLPPPAGQTPYEGVTNADWTLFAGATDAGVVVWPGDRASPAPRGRSR